ncbi:hypothetical protein ACWDRR_12740 [Kitasatospora sp. NPDC003701]
MIESTELRDVVFLEVAAKRELGPESEDRSSITTPMMAWFRADGDDTIEVRCRLQVASDSASFVADAVAVFSVGDKCSWGEGLEREFTDKVGVTVLYPYLREAVHSSAMKLGVPAPLLSLINPFIESAADLPRKNSPHGVVGGDI